MTTGLTFGQRPLPLPQLDQLNLGQALMNQVQPFSGQMAANRNAMNMMPLANTATTQAQSVAQGQGPSFQFQDLNRAFQLDPRNTLSNTLLQQGMRGGPVRTPLEGIGRLSQSLVGAMLQKRALDRLEGQEATRIQEQNVQRDNLASALSNQLSLLPENSPIIPIVQNIASASGPTEALNTLASIQANQLDKTPQPIFKNVLDQNGNIIGQAGFNANDEQVGAIQYAPAPKMSNLAQTAIDAGFTPGTEEFQNFITENVNKGKETVINLSTSKAGEGLQKELVADYKKLQSGNRDLNESRINVDSLLDLLAQGTQTGFGQPEITALQRFYQAGFDKDYKVKEIADKELFLSLTNKMIGPLVKQLGQNPTDRDLNFIIEASPTLGKTVEGNRLILMAMKESQNRARLRADFASQFLQSNAERINDPQLYIEYNVALNTFEDQIQNNAMSKSLRQQFTQLSGNTDINDQTINSSLVTGGFIEGN